MNGKTAFGIHITKVFMTDEDGTMHAAVSSLLYSDSIKHLLRTDHLFDRDTKDTFKLHYIQLMVSTPGITSVATWTFAEELEQFLNWSTSGINWLKNDSEMHLAVKMRLLISIIMYGLSASNGQQLFFRINLHNGILLQKELKAGIVY